MKVISLRIPDALHVQLRDASKADGRSLNGFIVHKLQSDINVVSTGFMHPTHASLQPQEVEAILTVTDGCHDCDQVAYWETHPDWDTGEIRFYCDPCVRKGKSPKQYKMFKSKMKKL